MIQIAVDLFVQIANYAIPIALVFCFCNLIVDTFMSVAFGGRIWFGKR